MDHKSIATPSQPQSTDLQSAERTGAEQTGEVQPSGQGTARRAQLDRARVMLIFTPQLCEDPLEILRQVWSATHVIQIRPKEIGSESNRPSNARETFEWSQRVIALANETEGPRPLLLVNDRVDVAQALLHEGIDGVHLGQTDTPARIARKQLGPNALIGLSTHNHREVLAADREPIDYLGFGAVFPTETKTVTSRNNTACAWVAAAHSSLPVFPIGGIHKDNVWLLRPIGRAAVGSGILGAQDPRGAAIAIDDALQTLGAAKRSKSETRPYPFL